MSHIDKRTRKKRRWGRVFEYSSYERSLVVGDEYQALVKELTEEYTKRKSVVVTPQEIASKRDIRVSVAKRLLSEMVEKQILKLSFKNRRLCVYEKV